MTFEELLAKIKARKGGEPFGYGLTTADVYVRQMVKAVGACAAANCFGDGDVESLLKESESRLVFSSEDSCIEDKATSIEEMKAILPKDVDLPKNTLMVLRHKLTTPREDRDRDILRTEGAIIDPKMPMLWQHMHTLPIGKRVATLTHDSKVLRLASVLLDINELTSDAAKLIEADVLRFSHGFRTLDWEDRFDKGGQWLGFDIKSFEIMEASLVSVPSNVDAEIELYSRDKLKSDIMKSHAKSLFDARPVVAPGVEFVAEIKATVEEPVVPVEPGGAVSTGKETKWVVVYETGKKVTPENCEPVSQLVEVKAGRELSASNMKLLASILDDLNELADAEDLKRGSLALVVRCRDQLKELIDRVNGEDDGKSVEDVVLPDDQIDLRKAASALLVCQDTELKHRLRQALGAQLATLTLDERGALLSKMFDV
jgi:HK97 family phage prohead protease